MARRNSKLNEIIPLTATAVDTIKAIRNALSGYKEPITRTELDILFRDHARVGSRSLSDSRLDWYTKYSLMYYKEPRIITRTKNQYLVGIDKEKVLGLYALCESINWYGFYPAQKVAISFKQYYREKKIDSSAWVSLSDIAKWLDTTKASIYCLYDDEKDIFSDAILKQMSPIDKRVDENDPSLAVYRPNSLANKYLDVWNKIHNWLDANEVTRYIEVPTVNGLSKRLANWK